MQTFNLYSIPVFLITSNRDILQVECNSILHKKERIYFSFFYMVLVKTLKCIIFLSALKDKVMSLKIYALSMNSDALFSPPLWDTQDSFSLIFYQNDSYFLEVGSNRWQMGMLAIRGPQVQICDSSYSMEDD